MELLRARPPMNAAPRATRGAPDGGELLTAFAD
jgi:hypothetical protein